MAENLDVDLSAVADQTMQEGTAHVRYELDMKSRNLSAILDILDPAHASPPAGKAGRLVFGVVAQGLRSAEKGVSMLASGTSEGAVDFRAGSCLLHRRFVGIEYETYYQPGRVLQHRVGGAWREKRTRQITGSAMFSPIWLVELLRGTTEAHRVRDEPSGRRIRAVATPDLAAPYSMHGMTTPSLPDEVDYAIRLDVWLDPEGRLARLIAAFPSGEPDEVVKEWTSGSVDLRLSDFSQASVPPPPADP
jgi:hypothetical protein